MSLFSILGIGFSVFSAAILFAAYVFFLDTLNKSWFAIASCAGLLGCISALQLWHAQYFLNGEDIFLNPQYRFWLILSPPMFFYFSRAVLQPEAPVRPLLLLCLVPLLLNFLPRYEIAIAVTFVSGAGYSFWLTNLIYGLRAQRLRFKAEMFFFGLFFVLAFLVLLLGLSVPYIDHGYFYVFYANCMTICYVLVIGALIVFPDLLAQVAEVAKLGYAASTLKDVDIPANLEKLEQLMSKARLYQNENLNLAMTAEAVGLTSHQLSELINRQFGMNFSRYVREQRVNAAKRILIDEPKSSVLSIGLEVGFGTQSNFYAAFKEITGISPGAFRKSAAK